MWVTVLLLLLFGGIVNTPLSSSLFSQDSTYQTKTTDDADTVSVSSWNTEHISVEHSSSLDPQTPVGVPTEPVSLISEGVLNPQSIIQSATYSSDWENLRTDTSPNPSMNLFIDQSHNWVGHQVDISVNNLQRLYVVNGSFDNGINGTNINGVGDAQPFGWTEMFENGGEAQQNHSTSYLEHARYVTVQNEGKNETNNWKHKKNTFVVWNQTVALEPYTESFYLRFDYRYDSGPLGVRDNRFFLGVFFDNNDDLNWDDRVYALDLDALGERDQWIDSGLLGINESMSANFNFAIGLFIANGDANLELSDFPGEEEHARFLRLSFDNVTLVGLTKPRPSEIELTASLPNEDTINITDTARGSGTGVVVHNYWEIDPLPVNFTSNSSVIFDCSATLYTGNFKNSTWETDSDSHGVKYTVAAGTSVNLTLWTVISYPGAYQNFEFNVTYPSDWENVTVYDSFPSNVTSQCTLGSNYVIVNGSTAAQFGWWQISFQAPNYMKDIATQVFNPSGGTWENETVFRCVNQTRVIGVIKANGETPDPLVGITTTWMLPCQSTWSQTQNTGAANGQFNSSNRWLGRTNTSAGVWTTMVSWNNGSEVAFAASTFELYHQTSLTAIYPVIETEPGSTITGMVQFKDTDNDNTLLDGAASLVANWSTTPVALAPNTLQQRWEGSFDTSLVGLGNHTVRVNATQNYFDPAFCYIIVVITYDTALTSPSAPWDSANWGTIKNITLVFNRYNLTTQTWEGVTNTTPFVQVECNWTTGYWTAETLVDPGQYALRIDTSSNAPSVWALNITISKNGYRTRQLIIALDVGERPAELTILSETQIVIPIHNTTHLILRYGNQSHGLAGADILVYSQTPASGINIGAVSHLGDGNYSIPLTPQVIETFTIVFQSNLTQYTKDTATITLTSTQIPTSLETPGILSFEVPYGNSTQFSLYYLRGDTDEPITGAEITAESQPTTVPSISIIETMNRYNVTLSANVTGTWIITFTANKTDCVTRLISIQFKVLAAPIDIYWSGMQTPHILEGTEFTFSIQLFRNGSNQPIEGSNVQYEIVGQPTRYAMTDMGDGTYRATIAPGVLQPGSYTIRIIVQESLQYAGQEFYKSVITEANIPLRILQIGTILAAILLICIAGYVSRRKLKKRRVNRQRKIQAAYQEFRDAQDIMAIIIMYKDSGLPVFTTKLHGEIQETLVSGFVTAVGHFRQELVADEKVPLFTPQPITDIAYASSTRDLLCVLFTMRPPSSRLLAILEVFSQIVDHDYNDIIILSRNKSVETIVPNTLYELVEIKFCLRLLAPHRSTFGESVPRKFRELVQILAIHFPTKDIKLSELANHLVRQGKREEDAYHLIKEAISKGYLIAMRLAQTTQTRGLPQPQPTDPPTSADEQSENSE